MDRYNVAVDVGRDGTVHVAYAQRQEAPDPLSSGMSPLIDTYYQESHDGATTFSVPLKADKKAANFYYGAFSRDGLFEGDYNQVASGAKLVYIVRTVSFPLSNTEPAGLVYEPNSATRTSATPDSAPKTAQEGP